MLFCLNKRLHRSSKWKYESNQQAIALHQAGGQGIDSTPSHKLVDCVNRVGLWRISNEVEQIAEIHFKNLTLGGHIIRIEKEKFLNNLVKNHEIVTYFWTVGRSCRN